MIAIKNMKMPSSCMKCELCCETYMNAIYDPEGRIDRELVHTNRLPGCPLIEVKDVKDDSD